MTTKIDTKNENMGQNNKHISNPTNPKGNNTSRNKLNIYIPNPKDPKNNNESGCVKISSIPSKPHIIKNSSKTIQSIKNKRR